MGSSKNAEELKADEFAFDIFSFSIKGDFLLICLILFVSWEAVHCIYFFKNIVLMEISDFLVRKEIITLQTGNGRKHT